MASATMPNVGAVLLAAALLAACGAGAPDRPAETGAAGEDSEAVAADAAERAAVLGTVDRFFAAMGARDAAAYEAVVVPEAMTFSVRIGPDGPGPVRARPHAEHIAALAASEVPWNERFWDPTVLVHGPIALVWTPYDFRLGDEFSHCGIDAFELMWIDGEWKLTNGAWTAEPDGCDPGPPVRTDSPDAERRAVLDVVQRLFDAMAERDVDAYAAVLVPEATYFTHQVETDGREVVRMRTGAEDIAAFREAADRWEETIRDPIVLVHPPLAVVWAPYEFLVDGEFSHCGVNIFQLMKMDGEWKMTTATWTVETEGCAEGG